MRAAATSRFLVGILLRQGIDFRWTNALGNTALAVAREQHTTNLIRLLEALGK